MVDPGRLRRLLADLDRYRDRLAELSELPEVDQEGDTAYAGRYLVQVSAQACIDMANHVIASSGWRTPSDFRDAFTVLEEQGVIDPDLAERMRTARLRLPRLPADTVGVMKHASTRAPVWAATARQRGQDPAPVDQDRRPGDRPRAGGRGGGRLG